MNCVRGAGRRRAGAGVRGATLAAVALFSGALQAQEAPPGRHSPEGAGAVTGEVAGQPPPVDPVVGSPLPGWVDASAQDTTAPGEACGHAVEMRLHETPASVLLFVQTTNQSGGPALLELDLVTVKVDGALGMNPAPLQRVEAPTPNGQRSSRYFVLGSKASLRGMSRVRVELPFHLEAGRCVTVAGLARQVESGKQSAAPTDEESSYRSFEFYLGIEQRLAATENHRRLGGDGRLAGLIGFGFHFGKYHGAFFDLAGGAYRSSDPQLVLPDAVIDEETHVGVTGIYLSYALRLLPVSWLALSYSPGLGLQWLRLDYAEGNGDSLASTTVFALRQRLRVLPFVTTKSGKTIGFGVSFDHTFIPAGSLGAAPVSGSVFGAAVEFVITTN